MEFKVNTRDHRMVLPVRRCQIWVH